MAQWTTNSNEAFFLSLVRAPEDKEVLLEDENYENFHPRFTYPIYGEDETVYGYKDLKIDLRFASGSLAQYLSITWGDKLKSKTVDDVSGKLEEFIKSSYETDEAKFLKTVEDDAETFEPMGKRIFGYKQRLGNALGEEGGEDDVEFEVYHATWDTPRFLEYHRRMQMFVPLFIEAGSYIMEDEETWEFAILFEKRKRRGGSRKPVYHFVGYSSLYPFWCFPEKVRMRLSQFVIVPPYQRIGHGSALYTAIYRFTLSEDRIAELTVEDPAEAFEDLRDRNDLRMLLNHKEFISEGFGGEAQDQGAKKKGRLGPPADKGWVEKWRRDLKIAGRQFHRLVEMLILRQLDPGDAKAMRAFRLQVKERLYRFNFEVLAQLEKQERLDKLDETFQSVKGDYDRILAMI